MPTELEQAAIYWSNTEADIALGDNAIVSAIEGFVAGSQYQSKKDEKIINGFMSRETVAAILENFLYAYDGGKIADWLDRNFPANNKAEATGV